MKPRQHRHRPDRLARPLLAGGTLLVLCASVAAQGARLGTVLDMARAADAQFAAARATAAAGREKLDQAQAAMRPNVSFSYSARINSDNSTAYQGKQDYQAGGPVLTATQPIWRLASWIGIDQAQLQVQLTDLQLRLAEQDLLLRVAKGYFDVLQARDELAAATAQKDALVQQLAQTRRAFEVGTVPVTDFNETQARHDLAQAQEIAARNELESRQRVLEKSIAAPLPPLARLVPAADGDVLGPQREAELVAAAPRDSLPVGIGRLAVQVAEKEAQRRAAGHQPTLDLVATARNDRNVNVGAFGGNNTRQRAIGLELNLPLYQGGGISSRAREALADLQRAREELTNAERQALLDASQAQLGVRSGSALTTALKQALSSSETQLRSTQRGLQVGVRTRVDVLNAEQQLFATRKDLAAARYRTVLAGLQLRAAAGVLADADLRALDALLVD